ncbi:hypothetical protein [Bacillus paramycoides]|uniref:hypothetical protein n=1 Tax=Bacillus paramycoides TaxID=2026194 RepID=UPI002E21AFA1|nr:hypothetical protein [Bacillus paramycoides]
MVESINDRQSAVYEPIQKEHDRYVAEVELLKRKLDKTWEAYMDEMISKSSYMEKSKVIEQQMNTIKAALEPLGEQLRNSTITEVRYEQVKAVLEKFAEAFQKALTREQRKRLLHLLIHQVTISEDRTIKSIQLKLNNDVLQELKLGAGDLSMDESPAPFSVLVAI